MKRFDRDGDGMLDDAERAEAKRILLAELSDASAKPESNVAAPAMEPVRVRLMTMFDRNQDGRLDEEERAAAQKFAAERGLGAGGEMRDQLVKRFDRNGNGRLEPDERAALQKYFQGMMAPEPAAAASASPAPKQDEQNWLDAAAAEVANRREPPRKAKQAK